MLKRILSGMVRGLFLLAQVNVDITTSLFTYEPVVPKKMRK
ncbi:MAG: cyclic lactone autoinducer peptide [Bacillota bacterium]